MKKYKLFASYLQQKPSKSIELVAAKQKHSKILNSQQDLKNAIFAGRFAMFLHVLLCHCYVFALQQLILYFLMVFVANSLQIACVSSFFLWFLLQIACKNEEIQAICKLFATKTIKKYRISCCKART